MLQYYYYYYYYYYCNFAFVSTEKTLSPEKSEIFLSNMAPNGLSSSSWSRGWWGSKKKLLPQLLPVKGVGVGEQKKRSGPAGLEQKKKGRAQLAWS